MRLRYRAACVVAAVMGVALAVVRLVLASDGSAAGGAYAVILCGIAATVAAVFFLCGFRRNEPIPTAGAWSRLSAFSAAWVGVALLVYAFSSGILQGEYPYPQPITATALNRVLAILLFAFAILGGVFFLLTAVRWFLSRRTDCVVSGWLALCPVAWTWARLLWYITSFVSAVNRYRSITETALILFEMLFLMTFARHASGIEESRPRSAVPIALCTAALGVAACLTRAGAYLAQNAALYAGTQLLVAPDLTITVLAATFACRKIFGEPSTPEEAPEEAPEEENESAPVFAEEMGAEFLLDVNVLALNDEIEDESAAGALSAEERRPLELEDILNEIINGNS